ncbi:MAG TPA: endonuclease/exonuclease/phosphatase family protein [Bryobacteraceae bacterium]|jgi:hypothetical protein|nr:endonuclease/exonuclease/phosphatase family protein [Bryobacteraceae bacterium]
MSTNPPIVPSKKRKRGDITVLSVNVQGTDPDDLSRAIKKMRPDIISLQEAPKGNHLLYKTLQKTLTDLNNDSTSNTDFEFSMPEIVPEFPPGAFFVKPTVGVYPDQSVKKNYAIIYNKKKLKQRKKPKLLDYGKDKNRKKELLRVKTSFDGTSLGFGARPPLGMEFETTTDQKRIGVFTWHAPTINDPQHNRAMNFFEQSEVVETSMQSNHMTILCGDFNDQLNGHFLGSSGFSEGISHKFDHVIAHNASSSQDLLTVYPTEMGSLHTSTQDHFGMGCEFNF